MTIAATITALKALTEDALKSADDAQLARLDELSAALATLIDDEKERRHRDRGLLGSREYEP
jgi:hypothetical protein